ncbi:unnamed protein product [Phaedon cochleariae]|uniref:Uncharacterized protein n=1 Tax=Phaedon cochleariae TaxID=80249 RepID=A0A9P0DK34_PHACE|nr:unnamed protein product [Phaedon cochleariae]
MWDAFLDRTSQSCTVVNTSEAKSFFKKKNDLLSVEYLNYIHKDTLSYLDHYPMKNSKVETKKVQNAQKKKPTKPVPVYYRVQVEAADQKRPKTVPKCKGTEECKCGVKCHRPGELEKLRKNIVSLLSKPAPATSLYKKAPQPPLREKPLPKPLTSIAEVRTVPQKPLEISEKTFVTSDEESPEKDNQPRSSVQEVPVVDLKGSGEKKRLSSDKGLGLLLKKYLYHHGVGLGVVYKLFKYGEKGSGTHTRSGEAEDFYKLRDQCLQNGTLYEDPDFPAVDSSLFYSQRPDRYYEWKRPAEIVNDPQFFVEGYSRFDVQQGELGDCWLLAAAANLTLYRRLFFQIVPDDQDFDDKYAGIFHFRFWQYGKWIEVTIDDRLPTYRGQLIYLHSTEENEFWSALLEKAYAKLHGSYEALKGGSTCEAMEDFTGGVTEMYELKASPPNLFQIILKAYERSSLMGCSIEPDPEVVEAETPEGLVRGHAYSITRVQYVDIQTPNVSGKIPLLRLRNPWGNESEWNGPWSDNAPEWRFISESEKEELGLTFDNDGEFWMAFKDFQRSFSRLEICNLNPDSLSNEELKEGNKKRWEMSMYEGEWVRGVTAGGCRNFLESFWHNPQYRITLTEVDEGDDNDGECTMIVGLMQKNRRLITHRTGVDLLTVGFAIYHLPNPDRVPKPLDLNFFKYNAAIARSPSFINLREVSCRFKLPPGTYCIVPSTFDPNEEGEFLLRVFTEKENIMEENDDQVGYGEVDIKVVQEPTDVEKEETDKVYEFFKKLAGEDQEVDWMELKEVLDFALKTELKFGGFSKDICRSMVAMLDSDRSGKLGYKEFKNLWISIIKWKNVWMVYDTDKSGTFSGFELREALNSAGYRLNNRVLSVLMHRYGNKLGQINFDDFMLCSIKLKTMLDIFDENKDPEKSNTATFSMEEWLENTLYT